MKNSLLKILTTALVSLNIVATPLYMVYAEEQTETTIEQTTDTATLTDTLEEQTTTNSSRNSFGTILLAFLIPSILLIICYLIFKVFKF